MIRLGFVRVDDAIVTKPGFFIYPESVVQITANEQYVSRAALKLASISDAFSLRFSGAVVLDVGSSTGGFTDYALQKGAKHVIAVEKGTDQLHDKLRSHKKITLLEKTDIRTLHTLPMLPDIVVIDVSFVSLRDILPHIASIVSANTKIVAMCKPQFEAKDIFKHKGVIKNDRIRREILKNFEDWLTLRFKVLEKADSKVSGSKGNVERFYLLQKLQ